MATNEAITEVTRQTVSLSSGTVSYYVGGDAEAKTVVLLHGGGTDHALLSWRDTLPALVAAGYRVYAPDHPGYGHPLPDWPVTLENLLGYLQEFVRTLNLERLTLCGISMGGAMALGYALRHSENVEKLVLVGSYGLQDRAPVHTLSYLLVRLPGIGAVNTLFLGGSRWLLKESLKQIIRNPIHVTPELLEEVREALQNRDSQTAFNQWQRHEMCWRGTRTNYTPSLPQITQPVLLVHGSRDIGVPIAAAERAATLLPHARLEVFDGAGHWTQRDEPERFNRLLLTFLAE